MDTAGHRGCFPHAQIGLLANHRVVLRQILLMKVKNDHRSKFPNLSNWKEEA